jgi:hypothetical protein
MDLSHQASFSTGAETADAKRNEHIDVEDITS